MDLDAIDFRTEVLENVHVNGPRRCFYVDRTDLMNTFYPKVIPKDKEKVVSMSIAATSPGDNIDFFSDRKKGPAGRLIIHRAAEDQRWMKRNSTHFVKIIIPRHPKDNVFKLTEA